MLTAGVIGCGAISREHLAHLSRSPLADLAAVCDASPVTAGHARDRFGADRCYTDLDAMLDGEQLDVVHVLTPPESHLPIARRCLERGAHVVVEKPITTDESSLRELLEAADTHGRFVAESQNLLYNDQLVAIDEMVDRDRLGMVREIDIQLSLDLTAGRFGDLNLEGPGVGLPGGAVHDFLPHLAYLFLHFAGPAAVDDVSGWLGNGSGNARVGFDELVAIVRAGRVRGLLRVASDLQPDSFRLVVAGTAGTVETDFYRPYLDVAGAGGLDVKAPFRQVGQGARRATAGVRNLVDKVRGHGTYHGIPVMLDAYYRAFQDGRPPVDPERLLATSRLVDRMVALAEPAP